MIKKNFTYHLINHDFSFSMLSYTYTSIFSRELLCTESNGHPYYSQDVNLNENNSVSKIWLSKENQMFRYASLPVTSASSKYAAQARSLSLCCARRSTPNPNKTNCIRIWIQLQYIELPTNLDFVCKNKNYRVYMCTPMSYAGSAPVDHYLQTWSS